VSVNELKNPASRQAAPRAGEAEVSATTATTGRVPPPATSGPARLRAAGNTAGAPGSKARTGSTGSGGGWGSATAKPPVEQAPPVEPPAGLAPTQAPAGVGSHLPQAASSTAEAGNAHGAAQAAAAAERARAALRPVTERVLPPRGPRLGPVGVGN
jgi:hypothetical protein